MSTRTDTVGSSNSHRAIDSMCDEIDCDGGCDGDCCDNDCCCCCAPSTAAAPESTVEQDCLFYLCCAGCFLCPLFYVGVMKKAEEPTITPVVESAPAMSSIDNDDVSGHFGGLRVESTEMPIGGQHAVLHRQR